MERVFVPAKKNHQNQVNSRLQPWLLIVLIPQIQ